MNYQLHITRTAERDLENAADYIEFTFYMKNETGFLSLSRAQIFSNIRMNHWERKMTDSGKMECFAAVNT